MAFSVIDNLQKICEYFDGSKTFGRRLVLVYKIHDSGENDGVWTVRIEKYKCSIKQGEDTDYTVKMLMTAETYEQLVTGFLPVDLAYWQGGVRYTGQTLAQQEMMTYLNVPPDSGIFAL